MAVVATSEIATREVEVAVIDCAVVWLCFTKREKAARITEKKKQVQMSGEQRRKTTRQV